MVLVGASSLEIAFEEANVEKNVESSQESPGGLPAPKRITCLRLVTEIGTATRERLGVGNRRFLPF